MYLFLNLANPIKDNLIKIEVSVINSFGVRLEKFMSSIKKNLNNE